MARVLLGAPVYKREWILPLWFEYLEAQRIPEIQLGFAFVVAPKDELTMECLVAFHERHPEFWCFDITPEPSNSHAEHPENGRHWSLERYTHMALMRNMLLGKARAYRPDRYFSLDTDVLVEDPDTIAKLVELTNTLDAVAPLMYMTPDGRGYPSTMTWIPETERAYRRQDYPLGTLFQTDVIMAAKMMTPKVYDGSMYVPHSQGEDLGWSWNCRQHGFKLYCASNIYCPHIMSKLMLGEYLRLDQDPRLSV